MSATPRYCRYGIHGDISKYTNMDGTVVYRTRERPCDCTTPPPSSLHMTAPKSHTGFWPRRPANRCAAKLQRCPRDYGRSGQQPLRGDGRIEYRPSAASETGVTTHPLTFYEGGLQVVVPPLVGEHGRLIDYSPLHTADLEAINNYSGETVYPKLPSIPVVWPQPDLPKLSNVDAQLAGTSFAKVDLSSLPTSASEAATNDLTQAVAPSATVPPSGSTAACLGTGQQLPPLEATTTATTSNLAPPLSPAPCSSPSDAVHQCPDERHTLHTRWSIPYSAACGVPPELGPTTNACTPQSCPLTQIPQTSPSPTNAAHPVMKTTGDHCCLLCGANLKSSTIADAVDTAQLETAPAGVQSYSLSTPLTSPLQKDFLTRRDLHSVDEIMAHLLNNANAHGGVVQPPCGLPNCRLCCGIGGGVDGMSLERSTERLNEWWGKSFVCGSPAVTIIHNHYYK